jgi:hypothetical protein
MKYDKPEVVVLGPAVDLTRSGGCDKEDPVADCSSGNQGSATAYEADE